MIGLFLLPFGEKHRPRLQHEQVCFEVTRIMDMKT